MIRDLYNVYSNGTFPVSKNAEFGFPAATPATINYVSEIGFLCKPQITLKGAKVIDPSTGVWYRTEIANVIKSQGFIPFPLQARENQGSVDAGAAAVLAAQGDKLYLRNDPVIGSTVASNETKTNPVRATARSGRRTRTALLPEPFSSCGATTARPSGAGRWYVLFPASWPRSSSGIHLEFSLPTPGVPPTFPLFR